MENILLKSYLNAFKWLKVRHLINVLLLCSLPVFYPSQGRSQSFVDFSSILEFPTAQESSELSPEVQGYFQYLESRFANQPLDDILFIERASIAGPRLKTQDVQRIGSVTRNLLENVQSLRPNLNTAFTFPALRFDQRVEYIKQGDLDHYSQLYPRLGALKGQYGGTFDESRIKAIFLEWTKNKNSVEATRALADALILAAIPSEAFARASKIPPSLMVLHWNYILKSARELGLKLQLPNKIIDTLSEQSSLADFRPKSLLKGLILMPMTREEAIFKGVGPGECVRNSLFRYIDSFFTDSTVLKILKDGVEIGYVTLYKTVAENGQPIWLVETIQAPVLSLVKNKALVIRNLVASLQALSAQSGALLAVPGRTMNTYNFKEVVSSIIGMSEYISGLTIRVSFQNKSEQDILNDYALKSHSNIDQSLISLSGYKASSMVNAMTLNGGSIRLLSPIHDLDPASLEKYLSLLLKAQNKSLPTSPSDHPLVKKAVQLKAIGSDFATKMVILEIYNTLKAAGDLKDAALVHELVYQNLPKELWNEPFSSKYEYIRHRVENVSQKESLATAIKIEVLLSATTFTEFLQVMQLGDRGETFPALLLQGLNHFAKQNKELDWLENYKEFVKYTKTSDQDALLSRMIVDRIVNSEDFLRFSKIASGKEGTASWGDQSARSAFLAEESRRFTFDSQERRFDFFDQLLKLLQDKSDLQVRSDLMETFTTLKELEKLNKIGFHDSGNTFKGQALKMHEKMTLDTMSRILKSMTMSEIESQKELIPTILKGFEASAKLEVAKLVAPKFQSSQQVKLVMNSIGLELSTIVRPEISGLLKPELLLSLISSEPGFFREYSQKLRIGTPEALIASGAAKVMAEYKDKKGMLNRVRLLWNLKPFRSILHPDDAASLNQVLNGLKGHPEFIESLALSLIDLKKVIQVNQSLPEHNELLQKLALIAPQLKPDTSSKLQNVFGVPLKRSVLTAPGISSKVKLICKDLL